ncbi:MAG: orotidine 5'-phosphate decarboxylase [Anaerolineae bacterium]|nr:orotidine 5'-phosphate decarboxylase [Anaerolineae bacterium]
MKPHPHPLLQLALDGTLEQAVAVLGLVAPLVDIVELGTPLLYREGIRVATHIHHLFPEVTLLADMKILDAGEEEASIAFDAGCQYVTVLGVSPDKTIQGVVAAANRYGSEVMVDMMQVSDPVERGHHLLALGCDYLCVHTAFDQQQVETPLATLKRLRKGLPDASLAVAGGVGLPTVDAILAQNPAIVVVGGAIARAADPAAVTKLLRERMAGHVEK